MPTLVLYILGFLACSSLIVFSGSRLSKYGDIIADLTGMGKAWIGLILMASITSLPELITGISSIAIIDSPDIAVGDVMGSCAFNLLILAVLDYFVPGKPLSSIVTKNHVVAGFLGIFLITLSVISIVFSRIIPQLFWFSSASILIIVIYLVSIRIIYKNEHRHSLAEDKNTPTLVHHSEKDVPLQLAVRRYVLFALLVVAAAIALPYFANHLANQTGMNKSFIGTLLVAATTSLP
ncbi:MAG: sodium:calcium antiporter, partial [Chitinophagaceae bacterium]|nr:sodium:calcium antiporter [Chitinophagaceae bacterium]